MPRSTRADLVRSLSTLTRARGQLRTLLDPGHPLPICSRAREELLAFDACLEESLRELQRPAPDIRRLEPVWAAWRREAARQSAEAGDRCRVSGDSCRDACIRNLAPDTRPPISYADSN